MIEIFGFKIPDQITYTVITLLCYYLVYRLLLSFVNKYFILRMKRIKVDVRKQKTINTIINNILRYTFFTIAVLSVLGIMGVNTNAIIASIGVIGLAIGLAVQDILKDFLAGLFILFENQYAIGDIVTINGFKGEVIFLGLKTTKLRSDSGEIKIISNRNIIDIINYSLNEMNLMIDFDLSYDNDQEEVKKLVTKMLINLPKKIKKAKSEFIYLGINKLGDKITHRLSVKIDAKDSEEVKTMVLEEIKELVINNNLKR